jgi:hypothetical protein
VAAVCTGYGVMKQMVCDIRKSKVMSLEILNLLIEKVLALLHKVAQVSKSEASKTSQFRCETVMKWYVQQCLCIVKVRSTEINPAVDAIAKCMKIKLKQVPVGFGDFQRGIALQVGACLVMQSVFLPIL